MPVNFKNTLLNIGKGALAASATTAAVTALNKFGGGGNFAQQASTALKTIAPGAAKVLEKQSNRIEAGSSETTPQVMGQLGANSSGSPEGKDWRVRISLADGANFFYKGNPGVMAPLIKHGELPGVVFPYNPNISLSHTAKYTSQSYTHSNYPSQFYESSEVSAISIDGEFGCQTDEEAQYLLGAVYFFRACTKMWFGASTRAGTPPPIVFLDGYGEHYFPHVPCVITSFAHTMPQDVDYISTKPSGGGTRMPTLSSIQLSLMPVYSRRRVSEFNLDAFASGALINKGFI
jgi:hypothetical protein